MSKELEIKDKSDSGQFIKIAPFRKEVRKTNPHKHNNYFEIIYLTKGKGKHFIDNIAYRIEPPMIYFVRREQVHHWELQTVPAGYVLILKKAFMDKSLDSDLKVIFEKLSNISNLRIKDTKTIDLIFQLLFSENGNITNQNLSITEGLLKALLAKILQDAVPVNPVIKPNQRSAGIFQSFKELLIITKDIRNSVAYYADLLNTTPQNLNAICRKTINQSASAILAGYIISEAKRLILYTDKTIAEISQLLHFKDPSHFVKYFKKFTGTTPQSIRKGE